MSSIPPILPMNTPLWSHPAIAHCRACGQPVHYRLPDDGDNRERAICTGCQTIHYQNPINVVGTVPYWGDKGEYVLLCKRNIEPRKGLWTLPAGFMELGETTAQGAARETTEEAGAEFEIGPMLTLLNVVKVGQVHIYHLAQLRHTGFAPGPETMEAKLFREEDIPWDDIAFRTVWLTLKCYFADRATGRFALHTDADCDTLWPA